MIYFSPKNFPHLANLSEKDYEYIISRSLPPLLPLYLVVYLGLILAVMAFSSQALTDLGFSFLSTSVLIIILGVLLKCSLYLAYINIELYSNTVECKKYMDADTPQ